MRLARVKFSFSRAPAVSEEDGEGTLVAFVPGFGIVQFEDGFYQVPLARLKLVRWLHD